MLLISEILNKSFWLTNFEAHHRRLSKNTKREKLNKKELWFWYQELERNQIMTGISNYYFNICENTTTYYVYKYCTLLNLTVRFWLTKSINSAEFWLLQWNVFGAIKVDIQRKISNRRKFHLVSSVSYERNNNSNQLGGSWFLKRFSIGLYLVR